MAMCQFTKNPPLLTPERIRWIGPSSLERLGTHRQESDQQRNQPCHHKDPHANLDMVGKASQPTIHHKIGQGNAQHKGHHHQLQEV